MILLATDQVAVRRIGKIVGIRNELSISERSFVFLFQVLLSDLIFGILIH